MQDKQQFSKEFTDRGWEEMRKLLDKDKPVAPVVIPQKGLRRLWLWAVLAIGVFIVALSGGSFLWNKNKAKASHKTLNAITQSTNNQADIVLKKEENSPVEEEAILESNISQTTNNEASLSLNSKRSQNSSISTNFSKKITNPSPINQSRTREIFSNEKVQKSREGVLLKFEGGIEEKINNEEIKKEKATPPIASNENLKAFDKTEFLALLPVLPFKEIDLEEKDEAYYVIECDFEPGAKWKKKLFLNAGIRSYDFDLPTDYTAGLGLQIGKNNSRYSLIAGLNYVYRNSIYLVNENTIYDGYTVDDMALNGGNEDEQFPSGIETTDLNTFYTERASIRNSEVKYHFLEIPIALNYKLSSKWNIHAGLNTRTLLFSTKNTKFGLLNNMNSRLSEATEESIYFSEGSVVNFFQPNKIDFAGLAGISFQATKRLGLNMQFQQGLRDVYPNLKGTQVSNSLQFGFSWRLK